jgi:DNA-binding HxlR family transcriptional regulator
MKKVSSSQSQEEAPGAICPHFHQAIELIGKRWTGAIVCALIDRPMRYAELRKTVPGLSDRLLSQRLRELEEEGLVERQVEAGMPVRVTYSLTEMGKELDPVLAELKGWARRWRGQTDEKEWRLHRLKTQGKLSKPMSSQLPRAVGPLDPDHVLSGALDEVRGER